MAFIVKVKSFLKKKENTAETAITTQKFDAPIQSSSRPKLTSKTDNFATKSNNSTRNIYIGLDFGTTFTKVAYEIPSTEHKKCSVRFSCGNGDSDYYKDSILFFNSEDTTLSITRNTESDDEIRYFKYAMISNSLPRNEKLYEVGKRLKNNIEELCSAFFLTNVISYSKKFVSDKLAAKKIMQNLKWHINMGVPVTEKDTDSVYKTVLNVATEYSEKYPDTQTVNIFEFDKFFSENKDMEKQYCNTLPELYAEILLYQQDNAVPSGFYSVGDAEGGTVDIATFLKTVDENGTKVECISQSIESLGFDSLTSKIVSPNTVSNIFRAKENLTQRNIDYFNLNRSSDIKKINLDDCIDSECFYQCIRDFRTAYGSCLVKARNKQSDLMHKQSEANQPMKYLLLGGAARVSFYGKNIRRMITAHKNAGIPNAEEEDILKYLNNNFDFEIENNPRLLISQMLAQPYELIPHLENMPWNFPPILRDNTPPEDYNEPQI